MGTIGVQGTLKRYHLYSWGYPVEYIKVFSTRRDIVSTLIQESRTLERYHDLCGGYHDSSWRIPQFRGVFV